MRVRGAHEGPFAFLLGKHGSRRRYLGDVRRLVSPEAEAYGETAARARLGIAPDSVRRRR